jgi:hypothetical protein
MWTRPYTRYLQLRIYSLQYFTEPTSAAIGDMPIFGWPLYCKLWAKYSAYPPVNAMWTVLPDIYNAFTAPHIQTSIFIWSYLRCYMRYLDNSMLVILQAWCQIQRTSSGLRCVNCCPRHIQCIYSSAYSDSTIRLKVGPLLLEISRQFSERYTAKLVPFTAHILQFTLCELLSRTYTMYLQLRIFRLQYFTEPTSAAIGDMPIIGCPLYCKLWAKYSAYPPVYAMWTVVPLVYKVFTAPHIWASIYIW